MSEAIRLEGVKDLEAALKKFDENAYKNLNRAINQSVGRIKRNAQGYISSDAPPGLKNWMKIPTGSGINGKASGTRQFPVYDEQAMRSGLRKGTQRKGRNRQGWGSVIYVEQKNPAGNIYEKAGIAASNRTNYSRNPNASTQFKEKMQNFYFISKGKGRALIRAGVEDAGRAKSEIERARYEAELKLQADFNIEAARHG